MTTSATRRIEDRDKIHSRLGQMEQDYMKLAQNVLALENKLNLVGLEQTHIKDLFDARLKTIEKAQELQLNEVRQIGKDIQQMGSEIEKTPAGRALKSITENLSETLDAHTLTILAHEKWHDRVDGVLLVLKWVGAGGIVALIVTVGRMMRLLP